jgi:hypothetical protein
MRLVFTLGALACLGGGGYVVWLLLSKVVAPWLDREARDADAKAQLQAELREIVHQQQLTTSQQAWQDLQRHRQRLEGALDIMHGTQREESHDHQR